MQNLNVTLIQTDLAWENIEKNLCRFEALMENIEGETDLIILPEMFSTGFSMNAAALAEPMDGPTVTWMKQQAVREKAVIVGSIIIRDNNGFFNRLFWMQPEGQPQYYDKRHLFRMADEHRPYSPGNHSLIVNLKGWNIRPFICYDLRFPVWSRNVNNAYDLAVYIANWPERRSDHWRALLKARAIENQAYVAGVNRIGMDGQGIAYAGDSSLFDALGNELFYCGARETVTTLTLDYDRMRSYREKFPVWRDGDAFIIQNGE